MKTEDKEPGKNVLLWIMFSTNITTSDVDCKNRYNDPSSNKDWLLPQMDDQKTENHILWAYVQEDKGLEYLL